MSGYSGAMPDPRHPAQSKAQLRELLRVCRVVTVHQLRRLDLEQAATWLDLPRVTYTCRTRVTQGHSAADLTFAALDPQTLSAPPRDLMHWAGTAEAYLWYRSSCSAGRIPEAEPGERWTLVDLAGRERGHLPDATILRGPSRRDDAAVEYDTGYVREHQVAKLHTFAAHGYAHIIWATTVHGRVRTLCDLITAEQAAGRLPNLRRADVLYACIWRDDPYPHRPRCHKANWLSQRFEVAAPPK